MIHEDDFHLGGSTDLAGDKCPVALVLIQDPKSSTSSRRSRRLTSRIRVEAVYRAMSVSAAPGREFQAVPPGHIFVTGMGPWCRLRN